MSTDTNDNRLVPRSVIRSIVSKIKSYATDKDTASSDSQKTYIDEQIASLQSDISSAKSGVTPVSFSITSSSWAKSTDYSDYAYQVDVTASGLTSSDSIDVRFDVSSIISCTSAGINICSACITNDGSFRLYATGVPTSTISGVYLIQKGS